MKSWIDQWGLTLVMFVALQMGSLAQMNKKIPPTYPKLVVGIVIDPMSIDQLNRYWSAFGDQGFKRLVREGTFYKNASYGSFFSEAESGLATLTTGTYPSTHGIVGESWYEPLTGTKMRCTEDQSMRSVGGGYESGLYSPAHLLSSTFGDELRMATQNRSKVFGVGLSPANAILASGHLANAAWWLDVPAGKWVSSTFYIDSLPGWVSDFNQKDLVRTYLSKTWSPLLPLEKYQASSRDISREGKGLKGQNIFPYDLEKIARPGKSREDLSVLLSTPFANTLTKDFAINLIIDEELGQDEYCDYLGIVFSANEHILRAFGNVSVEMEDAVLRLDRELGHFFSFLDEQIGLENVIVYVTASRGIPPGSAYSGTGKMPSGYFRPNQALALLRSYLNAVYGEGEWVNGYYNHQVYLNRTLIESAGMSLTEVQDRVSGFMVQFQGVGHVIAAHELSSSGAANSLYNKLHLGYYPKRSGDVVIVLNPGWVEEADNSKLTGPGFWYDTHVPLFFYGWKIGRNTWYRAADLADVSPTLSFFLDIPVPNGSDGRLFLELLDKNDRR